MIVIMGGAETLHRTLGVPFKTGLSGSGGNLSRIGYSVTSLRFFLPSVVRMAGYIEWLNRLTGFLSVVRMTDSIYRVAHIGKKKAPRTGRGAGGRATQKVY